MNPPAKIIGALIALGAGIGLAGGANATVLSFDSGNIISGSFGNSHIPLGDFTDTLDFTIPGPGSVSISLTSNTPNVGGPSDLDFSLVSLSGPGGVQNFSITNNGGVTGTVDTADLVTMLDYGSYQLTISGYSHGDSQYGGNTAWDSSVPEPASWAMMVAGFGLVGGTLRRRGRTAVLA